MTKYIPYIAAISVLLLAVAIFQLFTQAKEIKGLKESANVIQEQLEDQKEDNQKLIDSLTEESKAEVIKVKLNTIDSLYKVFEANKQKPKYDTSIDNITDPDSIDRLFTRYYPRTKTGGS